MDPNPSKEEGAGSSRNTSEPGSSSKTGIKKRKGKRKSKFNHNKSGSRGGRPRKSDEKAQDLGAPTQGGNPSFPSIPILSPSSTQNDELEYLSAEVPEQPLINISSQSKPSVDSGLTQAGDGSQEKNDHSLTSEVHEGHHDSTPMSSNEAELHTQVCTDFTKPELEVIEATVVELQRRIHLPWIIVPEDDGLNILLLSRDRQRSVQRRAFFSYDGKKEISIHRKDSQDTALSDILQTDVDSANVPLTDSGKSAFISRVVTVVNRLRSFEVCVGVDDSKFESLWELETSGDIDKNPYGEARYIKTFRPRDCQLVVPTLKYTKRRCPACIQARVRLSAKLPHHVTSEAPRNTPNIYLDRNQLISKVQKQQKELSYARAQIAKLKEELKKSIERDGVDVDDELSNDLCSILDSANLTPVQALFFEQQLKAANAKDARGRRWHPTLIRFALLLRTISGAAYKAVQDSGLITLPSERTLYEYSHVISPEAGCTKDKLSRVTKHLIHKYPEAYQTYHILLMDEMHINKKLVYMKSTGEMVTEKSKTHFDP